MGVCSVKKAERIRLRNLPSGHGDRAEATAWSDRRSENRRAKRAECRSKDPSVERIRSRERQSRYRERKRLEGGNCGE